MSLPRHVPPAEPPPELLALFEQPDRIPAAVRRQADFFVFFARTIFPMLEDYRSRLAPLYCPDNGRPAWEPVRLLGVLILQYVLRQADRQAAEAVQYDQRWRLALHLPPQEATFDPSLLVRFRNRLLESGEESLAFAAVLEHLIEQGWVPKRSRQRLDSTQVWGLLSDMSRLECARETVRLLLENLEAEGLLPPSWSGYWERYVEAKLDPRAGQRRLRPTAARCSPWKPFRFRSRNARPSVPLVSAAATSAAWRRSKPARWTTASNGARGGAKSARCVTSVSAPGRTIAP
jgi:transposase